MKKVSSITISNWLDIRSLFDAVWCANLQVGTKLNFVKVGTAYCC